MFAVPTVAEISLRSFNVRITATTETSSISSLADGHSYILALLTGVDLSLGSFNDWITGHHLAA